MDENTLQFAWFQRDTQDPRTTYHPLPLAQGRWKADQMHGVAISGLLALALEEAVTAAGREDLVPARYHVDLFRPARMQETTTSVTVVREASRLMLVDATVSQDGEVVARASGTFLKPTANPEGRAWTSPAERPVPPPAERINPLGDLGGHHIPLFRSEAPWSDNFAEHQNPGRHQTWQTAIPVVLGGACTPFQAVASLADSASMVTNWGSHGVQFINTDIDLTLTRLPDGVSLGLRATDRFADDGLAVGIAEVYDAQGSFGAVTITSLANAKRSVDFTDGAPTAEGVLEGSV
ncbi:acyl-CoA thioesterase domain-containing protein [Nocardioides faecalis]|uniref:acyl-CoA thioesterase domain-containing protein n=1 Tax=Nocardioides faecalis TaxID=2803858 RepID=UPI0027DC885D|nr:acyl-CoA thioesterase domain-containing protein [Nocardioides faecalis]